MKITDTIRRASRSLRHAKIRTLLTSMAIAVGALTLTFAIAAGQGAREYAKKLISSNVDSQTLAVTKDEKFFSAGTGSGEPTEYDENSVTSGTGQGAMTLKQLTQLDVEKISKTPGVASVTPVYTVQASYITRPDQKKYTARIEPYNPSVKPKIAVGAIPNTGQMKDDEVTLPESFIKALGFSSNQAAVGQPITVHIDRTNQVNQSQIQSILETQGVDGLKQLASSESEDVSLTIIAVTTKSETALQDSSSLLVSENEAKNLVEYKTKDTSEFQKYSLVTVKASNGTDPEALKQILAKEGYSAKTAKDLQGLLFTIVNVIQGIVGGFGILALIASVFGIINTQYISVLERTQQIGLMKALGMRRRDVSRLFRFEAAWIGFLGGIIGAGIAWGIGTLLNPVISDKLGLGAENHLLIFQPLPIMILVVGLILIAIGAGILPARKAAKLDPVEALRTE